MTFKCGVNNPMYGKPAWNKGITHTDEARKKISKSHKGKTFSEDHKRKISLSLKGHAVSEEHKNREYWNALILNKLNYINLPTSSGVIL